jgi:YesN/AraC family two-component response regulator
MEISRSYQEAVRTLNHYNNIDEETIICWYKDTFKESNGYIYTVEQETRLLGSVKTGNKEEVEKILISIYDDNIITKKANTNELIQLAYHIKGTMIRVINSLSIDQELRNSICSIQCEEAFTNVYKILKDCFLNVCDVVNKQKKSHNNEMMDKIIQIINKEYNYPSLSLYSIASQVNLTEGYLSHFFKEQSGENFKLYLETLRINHACQMLVNSDMSISIISQKVGHNSDQVFRRAFKRNKGVTPNLYRDYERNKNC